ncbi:hypothetical protein L596_027408 [Steinernema carpocapsae]|uniref:Uncharacterized protein n=1 Tax=Steinernema carpocapsae TaxID=34508 RepID=A0A4U5M477_STECR|nr:hypothetical protein L596_027408 [Steinernema carpocapsae]
MVRLSWLVATGEGFYGFRQNPQIFTEQGSSRVSCCKADVCNDVHPSADPFGSSNSAAPLKASSPFCSSSTNAAFSSFRHLEMRCVNKWLIIREVHLGKYVLRVRTREEEAENSRLKSTPK